MSKYISPDLIEKARKVDLLTYLKNYEPNELVKVSQNEYTTKTHDSLRISNGFWNWFSVGIGGRNAMDYLEKVKKIKFPKSAEIVLNYLKIKTPMYEEKVNKLKVKNLILPEKNLSTNIIKSYLKSRGISEEIIEKCIQENLIYEEKYYHNVVFVGYDENKKAKYAGCRATNESNFKNDATGSDKMYSFRLEAEEKTDKIFIFEGAIDLLSYATLLKLYGKEYNDKTLISLSGVYQPAKNIEQSKVPIAIQNYLAKHSEITKIYLCFDNDKAGRNASKALKTVISKKYEVIDKPPKKGKDYNEYLCNLLEENLKEKLNKEKTR